VKSRARATPAPDLFSFFFAQDKDAMKSIIPIRDWSDGYSALKHHAEQARGAIEGDLCAGDWERWPRTTGGDALVIAAFLHPHLSEVTSPHGSAGAQRRWMACLHDLLRWAGEKPNDEYADNRRFWAEVLRVCVHLSSHFAPLPTQAEWETMFGDLACSARRNGLPREVPFGPFSGLDSFKDLYVAQVLYLQRARGMDRMDPEPGMTGGIKNIPRATNADVQQLVAFWGKQLEAVQKVIGHKVVAERWAALVAEVEQTTKGAAPSAVYPKNNAFWRVLGTVSTQVAVADEAPTKGERIAEAIGHGATSLPDTLWTAAKAVGGGAVSVATDAASAVASGAGKVAGGLFGSLLSTAGVPLAVVGGGILGAFLLLRRRHEAPTSQEKR
jgi:hypothetical protein